MAAPRLPIVLLLWLCLFLASRPAGAADPTEPQPRPEPDASGAAELLAAPDRREARAVRVTEILAALDRPEADPSWLSLELARMRVSGKYGLIYARQLEGLELRLRGPALGHSTNVGLSLELRF